MFLFTFGLGEWSVANWASGHENTSYGMSPSSSTILEQKRNRPNGNRSLRSQVSKEVLKTFLNSIPKLPSHYCRKNHKKIYFEPLYGSCISDVFIRNLLGCVLRILMALYNLCLNLIFVITIPFSLGRKIDATSVLCLKRDI